MWPHIFSFVPQILCLSRVRHMSSKVHNCTTEDGSGGGAQLHNCTTGGGAQLHPTSSWAALESRARLMGVGRHPNSPTIQHQLKYQNDYQFIFYAQWGTYKYLSILGRGAGLKGRKLKTQQPYLIISWCYVIPKWWLDMVGFRTFGGGQI